MKPIVSIVKYANPDSVAKAIEMCDGFKNLKSTHRVLLKPNICTAAEGFIPPYGTVTTTKVVEGTVRALKDFGVNDITIGEGTVTDELGTNTMKGYKWIQLDRLAKRYGVKLIDFNAGPHKRIKIEGVSMRIAEAALDTDFFINLPVLKTHGDTRVSLAGKNLKGCLSIASKRYFHLHGFPGIVNYHISRLMEAVPQHLAIIDGIYVMERGPDATLGTARPRGILVASTDFLAVDSVGVRLLGAEPTEVKHLNFYAERHGRMGVLEDQEAIEVRGERIEDHAEYLPWENMLLMDFKDAGHTGLEVNVLAYAICTGCYINHSLPGLLIAALSRNKNFNNLRLVVGRDAEEDRNSPRTILFGNCAINANKHLDRATKFKGCPPKFWASCFMLVNQMPGLFSRIAFYVRMVLYFARAGMGIGVLPLPRFDIYKNNTDYDPKHFRAE